MQSKTRCSPQLSCSPLATLGIVLVAAAGAPAPLLAQTYRVIHAFERPDPLPAIRLRQDHNGSFYGVSQSGGGGHGTVFRIEADGTGYTILHAFHGSDGSFPVGTLAQGADGTLYGTTMFGGAASGRIFAINPDGSGFRVLPSEGAHQDVLWTPGGTLYGVNSLGIFRIKENGSGFTYIHSFGGGEQLPGPLTAGADGTLYGTTYYGGLHGLGTVFRLKGDGTGFSVLHSFGATDNRPTGALVWMPPGVLVGTFDGPYFGGVYRINDDGSGYSVLRSFTAEDGSNPVSGLVLASDGLLYGTNANGGGAFFAQGTIYRIAPDGSEFALLHTFMGNDGAYPRAGVIEGVDGLLYGFAELGGLRGHGAFYRLTKDGSAFTTLLAPGSADGDEPSSGLAQAPDATLYGTTARGGLGHGTVFAVEPDGSGFTTLHTFTGDDGSQPLGTLLLLGDALYGTASLGGPKNLGSVFTLATDGSGFTVLHQFDESDGARPLGGLVVGNDDMLYGTTSGGGALRRGTVYKISTSGELTTLHSFAPNQGEGPFAGLIVGLDGSLYGTTNGSFSGAVFRIEQDGSGFEILHQFRAGDGAGPQARLLQVATGPLFGTTTHGGAHESGTVFRINPDGSGFTTLHSFGSSHGEGLLPFAGLTLGADGWLYGSTSFAGSVLDIAIPEWGTLFKLKPDGSQLSALYPFRAMTGTAPKGDLLLGTDSVFYGTGSSGGSRRGGVVFSWTPGTSADLSIDLQPSTEIAAIGGPVAFELTLTNPGPHDASGLVIRSSVPPGLTFLSGSSECESVPPSWVVCGIPFLEKGTSTSLVLAFTTTEPGTVSSTVTVSADTMDFNPDNNTATAVVPVAGDGGVFRFAAATQATSETGYVTVTVLRELGTRKASVRYATTGVTAKSASDFTSVSGTLLFAKGVTSRSLTIPLRGDCRHEGDEEFQVVLSHPSAGAILGSTTATTVTIQDDDDPGQIRFGSVSYSNAEAGRATITVTRSPLMPGTGLACAVSVRYATSDGTARAGEDYAARSGVLAFGAGGAARSFVIPVVADRGIEPDESVILTLTSPTAGAQLNSPSAASLEIVNNDFAGAFELRSAAVEAREGTSAVVTVIRSGGTGGTATVDYTTIGGTAEAGSDYAARSGTLTFGPGVLSRTFKLPILLDGLEEGDETIGLMLSVPTAGGTLGAQSTATVTIVHNAT